MWNGKGFPPVGTVCEFLYDEVWLKGEFLGIPSDIGVMRPTNDRNGRIFVGTKSLRPLKTEWNGKGFPPVGTICECMCFGEWRNGEVMQVTETMCRVRLSKNSPDFMFTNPNDLRPLKSAVEIGNEQADWNGEGFPPVGIECEVLRNGTWRKAFVVGFDQHGQIVFSIEESAEFYCTMLTEHFRPFRTERQIAQNDMREIAMANPKASMVELFGLIHDAGYTKCQK